MKKIEEVWWTLVITDKSTHICPHPITIKDKKEILKPLKQMVEHLKKELSKKKGWSAGDTWVLEDEDDKSKPTKMKVKKVTDKMVTFS